ncbi:HAMP domain-containing histidine kinase [Actinoplanes sp. KI2]|uniref:sensor histidine kinase n=1 Tax=Actinoplanes sp. KI2 TaxID=2983315 RepID=UPI0021D56AA3|nr:HAMP domain-containing sensor histidine kinase [Actinoplanes sp. KI2]MCU7725049.1 HAMP domain-containing histidine kinase [Actinoplanes sp. KI2]
MRARLVLVVGALAAVALVVANTAGLVLIRTYLLGRIDDQLRGMIRPFADEHPGLPYVPRGRLGRLGPEQVMYVYDAAGLLDPARSLPADSTRPPVEPIAEVRAHAAAAQPYTIAAADGSADWRVIAVPDHYGGGYAVVGLSLSEVQQTTDQLLLIDAGVSALVLALLAGGAWFVVRLGLRPLTDMERLATDISAGNLSGRVADTDSHTEPGRLGLALNSMLTRIEAEVDARTTSERRLRQFVADASHELRTPLTSIRGFAELYRRGGAPPGPALDETMSRIEGEAGRMGVLVEDMLMLARLDQQRPPALRPVDLLEIAADTIRDAHARVPGRPVKLAGLEDDTDTFEPATVLGDEHGLRQVATNLVANALQHTPSRAQVTVRVGRLPARPPRAATVLSGPATVRPGLPLAVFEVTDDGPGVPAAHAPRVFERLYRADSSRTRGKGGGSGLGLSIVAAIVHGHGGWVELDAPRGGGATFRVLLPTSGDTV